MNDISFECVLPIESHAELIFRWRNDPETLAMSYHTNLKDWNSFHREFVHCYFNWPSLPPLFANIGNQRIGFIRLEPTKHPNNLSKKCCEISINMAPDYRGKGMGTKVLTQVNTWVEKQGYDVIIADVKIGNIKSHKAFLNAGYKKYEETSVYIEDRGESVTVVRYLYDFQNASHLRPIFVIAEAGSNWLQNGSEVGKELIDAAKEAGADAVKFQTFKAETLYVRNAGASNYLSDMGINRDIFSLMESLTISHKQLLELSDYCKKVGIEFMSSFFSLDDFEVINPLVQKHKIASYEISHPDLIKAVALSGKPLILSTGASSPSDIEWAVDLFRSHGGSDLTLLQCSAQYPAKPDEMNLSAIQWLRSRFGCAVGLSDHSIDPYIAPIAAVAYGATTIEKHFTIDKKAKEPDHSYAVSSDELKRMIQSIREVEKMVGTGVKGIEEGEKELYLFACRALQATKTIKAGDLLVKGENYAILRSGNQKKGAHPRFIDRIEGKKANVEIHEGSGILLEHVECK